MNKNIQAGKLTYSALAKMAGMVIGLWMLTINAMAADAKLMESSFVSLPDNKLEIRFDFDMPPALPKSYMTNSPARIVLDMWGVENAQDTRMLSVENGNVDKVNFAQVAGRLRVVVDLFEASAFESRTDGNSLFLTVGDREMLKQQTTQVSQAVTSDSRAQPVQSDKTRVRGVDFERTADGAGRVVVSLTDDRAGVDVIEEGNNVVVNLLGVDLSAGMQNRIDVQDFATPVMFIDSMASGENVSILIKPSAEPYDYMVYQTNNQLVVDLKPITQAEQDRIEEERFPYNGERIDLDFQNVEVRSVLQILAEVAEMNLVVSDNVGGNITLRLKNVPWDQALDLILNTNKLDKREMGNVLLIGTAEEISERERIELESSKQVEELAPLRTEFIQVDFRKASDMVSRLNEAKLISERGLILADDETNVLMVRETASRMEEIRSTLRRFDTEVAQVLIEARLVTANTTVSKDLGVSWGLGYGDTDSSGNAISIGSSISDVSTPGTIPSGLMVDLGANATSPASVAIGLASNSALLQLELSALESDGRIEVVSQPKVVTTNGKVALIESGSEIPYVTTDDDGDTDTEFKDVVLSLEVTPRINPGDRIAMDLVIKKDSVGETLSNGEISIIKNLLETSVVVPDGQTIVLGGVFENETSNTVNKTPLLGDLPVLGALFRNKSTSNSKTELLIFITPKLIKESLSAQ
ncbi:type IV pilus secretin PilQ [Amphritea sp. 1_MG-2023]|uniref:type IV pilus secretin PilQ n=1 Tax=Amphritea sp. 1_MG-2023 TaxID=3062670 RepID=UPI0026E2D235|nr:type IV pilus secretin PilQ [Amphritea sp. 1_MG-2023]MDO6563039.1 type IV pilus secretin PilQ [Amphritea sp. 1_MG-2023]